MEVALDRYFTVPSQHATHFVSNWFALTTEIGPCYGAGAKVSEENGDFCLQSAYETPGCQSFGRWLVQRDEVRDALGIHSE